MDVFRVRLNCVDHYHATPTALDPKVPTNVDVKQPQDGPKVPVLRVFGATESGQKVCAHIHGAFPYLYIKYDDSLMPDDVDAYRHQLQLSIEHALTMSYRRKVYDARAAFVAHITLVKGVPFYGYRVGYEYFFKVYLLNPMHMTRLADLLREGAIMKRVIQPYESHMQYILQWMCDYNLYGCAYIECSKVYFRSPVPQYVDVKNDAHKWHDRTIAPSCILDEDSFLRQSHCSIEVDIDVAHIINRHSVKERPIHHDFIERDSPFSADEKLVQSMAGLWRDETRRRKTKLGITDPGSSPFPAEVLISMSADPRNTQPGGWIHEEEYREKIRSIIQDEKDKSDGKRVAFDTFVTKRPFASHIKTTLESIEDFFPDNLRRSVEEQDVSQHSYINEEDTPNDEPQVDESRLQSIEDDDFPCESDEELARDLEVSQRRRMDKIDEHTDQILRDSLPSGHQKGDEHMSNEHLTGSMPQAMAEKHMGSRNLESLGIMNAGSALRDSQDAFEIDEEFISEMKSNYDKTPAVGSEPDRKKLKATHVDGAANDHIDQVNDYEDAAYSKDPAASKRATGPSSQSSSMDIANYQPETTKKVDDPVRRERSSAPQVQSTSLSFDSRLPFPVVKNPYEPHTPTNRSQHSELSLKGSSLDNKNSVSSAHSLESALVSQRPSASESSKSIAFHASTAPALDAKVCMQIPNAFLVRGRTRIHCFPAGPPVAADLLTDTNNSQFAATLYQDAFYSNEKDVPERAREYAGKEFKLESCNVPYLPAFDPSGKSLASRGAKPAIVLNRHADETISNQRRRACSLRGWEFERRPPTRRHVQDWFDGKVDIDDSEVALFHDSLAASRKAPLSQIDAATQKNKHGFKYSQKQASTSVQHETSYMSIMSLEIHINTRKNLVPNPEYDEISCIFWCLQSDDEDLEVNGMNEGTHVGVLALSEEGGLAQAIAQQTSAEVEEESSELDLINRMVDIVRQYDPDILTGYEVHGGSWGYMIERARYKYDYNLCDEFSRMKSQSHGRFGKEDDRWGFNHTSTIRVTGRHMINIWRAMRGELNLLQYTMENVVFQLCHRRIPHYAYSDLTAWYLGRKPRDLAKVLDYYISRVQLDLEILEQNELVSRTSEQARLLGVDFFSVFSRGSQFKVESLMFRIAKPENFLLPSPSRRQVGQQNALECLPLVMEPQSAFYNSPLLVLDFQSLYPSVMIAYNYCYSTYLGRVVNWRSQNKMGFTDYHRDPRVLELLSNQVNVAPNGIMYAKPTTRKSLLAKMLGEILETRVMVKSGMKVDKDDKTLQRLLNNRQLALKLIANVTYGYTSASFSGRMPCSEIADSIVQTGRETLEKAIALIHSVERWNAEVVYGDTDSLFVYLKGRTKDEAFDIGQEIAKTITDMNPRPIKLKFEKVYFPCVLIAKKRYVGFKYESKSQVQPDFDAKGIETVRRDGTPAEQKIEEKALKILFRTADLSQVKRYFQAQCTKIMRGKVSIQDFCFAKEVKLGTYSDKGLPPPGALISTRKMQEDPRAEPQYGERVPYVVVAGAPGARLIDRCVPPEVLLQDDNRELDAEYYINKNLIPPLERIFNLVGANVRQWYDEMPKIQRIRRVDASLSIQGRNQTMLKMKTLESYMRPSSCLVCREKVDNKTEICRRCANNSGESIFAIQTHLRNEEKSASKLGKVCQSCASLAWGEEVRCDSKDCPVFYTRTRHTTLLRNTVALSTSTMKLLERLPPKDLDW